MMLSFPCARCDRELFAAPVESEYFCPCGAEYLVMPIDVEGVSGFAIMLLRTASDASVSCPKCGMGIGLGDVPAAGLLYVSKSDSYHVIEHGAQECPRCQTRFTVPRHEEPAPRWAVLQ
jgi:DNA-directed RNA polymerase subunit RPC12/RpoP/ribosomal protein S27AE